MKPSKDLPAAQARTSSPKPNDQPSPGSIGNTTGLIVPKPEPNGGIEAGKPTALTNPPAKIETPQEASFWGKISGAVHTGLDVLGFVPGLGAIPDLANAGLYALEGDMVNAAISAVAAVPGVGDAAKAGTMVAKGGKAIAKEAAEKAAKEAAEKAAKEKAEKELAEKVAKEKAEKKAAQGGGYVTKKRRPRKPNREKWKKEGGTIHDHPDGSTTYTRPDGTSVTYNKQGYPDFSKHSVAEVKVEGLKGQYGPDEKIANKAIGLERTPNDYVWHHVDDGKTMQLVPKDIHRAFPHTGGASVIRSGG